PSFLPPTRVEILPGAEVAGLPLLLSLPGLGILGNTDFAIIKSATDVDMPEIRILESPWFRPVQPVRRRTTMFECLDCGWQFETVLAAERAALRGCPQCRSKQIELDSGHYPGAVDLADEARRGDDNEE